ncbi:MAG TPA: CotH kinase family protein [Planctomycetota bacterium]|nr:CotH kinase family protein [Planctomycetota bacterium]
MRARLRSWSGLAIAAGAALAFGAGCAPAGPTAPGLPTVRIDFPARGFDALFGAPGNAGDRPRVPATFTDVDRAPVAAKASLRGFSAWHHGAAKPSLRLEQKAAGAAEFVELSRPEDALAICNWLPDRLAVGLGLMNAHSEPVQLVLDRRNAGVYLRSLRPGDDLAAAGRQRGTFWKGDSLGARRNIDLWAGSAGWRASGADDARARQVLDELLATLREPATPQALRRLAGVLDVEVAARGAAVAVLVGSMHADRAHNHVLFFDPTRDALEPLLWDANGFGIHAEPSLPVEIARHPLAARLLCDPRFVHRRNQVLWDLLHGAGSAAALIATVREHVARWQPVLRADPGLGRLCLRRGAFELEPVAADELPSVLADFERFVTQRERTLLAHFGDARASVEPDARRTGVAHVTVFGAVAVRVSRRDGGPVVSCDGREAGLLLPGLSEQLFAAPQHAPRDGRGVAAPHAAPAALRYTIAAAPDLLVLKNAFTGEPVAPLAAPPDLPTRSVHPWLLEPGACGDIVLGPGRVTIDTLLEVHAHASLTIRPGTQLVFAPGAGLRCRGSLRALGSAEAPIVAEAPRNHFAGIDCTTSACVQLAHFELRLLDDGGPGAAPAPAALALRGCARAWLRACRIVHSPGDALEVTGGVAVLEDTQLTHARGHALVARAGAQVTVHGGRLAFADHGVFATDSARVRLSATKVQGNLVAARAEGPGSAFPAAVVELSRVACIDSGRFDVDVDDRGTILLDGTRVRRNPIAGAGIRETLGVPAAPAAPR